MRLRLILLFCLPACGPGPKLLAQQLGELEQLARQAGLKHQEICKAAPGRPVPASCADLRTCLHQVQTAGHGCKEAIDVGAGADDDAYSVQARACIESKAAAARVCGAAGIVEVRVTSGR